MLDLSGTGNIDVLIDEQSTLWVRNAQGCLLWITSNSSICDRRSGAREF